MTVGILHPWAELVRGFQSIQILWVHVRGKQYPEPKQDFANSIACLFQVKINVLQWNLVFVAGHGIVVIATLFASGCIHYYYLCAQDHSQAEKKYANSHVFGGRGNNGSSKEAIGAGYQSCACCNQSGMPRAGWDLTQHTRTGHGGSFLSLVVALLANHIIRD